MQSSGEHPAKASRRPFGRGVPAVLGFGIFLVLALRLGLFGFESGDYDAYFGPWYDFIVGHGGEAVGMFAGSPLAIATSTTRRRAWTAAGREAHHLIDPRTGAPTNGEITSATVVAPTILGADLAAKLLILEGTAASKRLDDRYRTVTTDRRGRTEVAC